MAKIWLHLLYSYVLQYLDFLHSTSAFLSTLKFQSLAKPFMPFFSGLFDISPSLQCLLFPFDYIAHYWCSNLQKGRSINGIVMVKLSFSACPMEINFVYNMLIYAIIYILFLCIHWIILLRFTYTFNPFRFTTICSVHVFYFILYILIFFPCLIVQKVMYK